MNVSRRTALLFLSLVAQAQGFSGVLFQEKVAQQVTASSKEQGVEIELPDFDELFSRIEQSSPLARLAMQGGERDGKQGLDALDHADFQDTLKWKSVEKKKKNLVTQIDKIDKFQGLPAPLLRFRCNVEGPCVGHVFTNFLTTNDFRSMWDESLANVYELYPIEDLDAVNMAMGFGKFGACTKIGVGYCTTKPSFGVDSREQLTMCGIQELEGGSCIIWGTEMEEWHNHLLPEDEERRTRAKSHLFSTTLVPKDDGTFDVEYVIQLEIGGNLPNWMTTPIVIDNVKNMFKVVNKYFSEGEGGALDQYLMDLAQQDTFDESHSLLMAP